MTHILLWVLRCLIKLFLVSDLYFDAVSVSFCLAVVQRSLAKGYKRSYSSLRCACYDIVVDVVDSHL